MADEKKTKSNIRALKSFRLKGKVVAQGEVVPKSDFAKKSDWQNLCHMDPAPRAEETSDAVGKPKAAKSDTKGGLPGAAS